LRIKITSAAKKPFRIRKFSFLISNSKAPSKTIKLNQLFPNWNEIVQKAKLVIAVSRIIALTIIPVNINKLPKEILFFAKRHQTDKKKLSVKEKQIR